MEVSSVIGRTRSMQQHKRDLQSSRFQGIIFVLVLVASVSAIVLTTQTFVSRDILRQVLSQRDEATRQTITNEEPYGYVSIADDTGKSGFWRFLSHAAFYEYRLPRGILKVSQHQEELTAEQAQELQFAAGLRKRPTNWTLSEKRNIFLDEPYRDKTVDRLFKRSKKRMVTSLVLGMVSCAILLYCAIRLQNATITTTATFKENSSGHDDDDVDAIEHDGEERTIRRCTRIRTNVGSFRKWYQRQNRMVIAATGTIVLLGSMTASGLLASSALHVLLQDDTFCPTHRCASSFLDDTTLLEFDACIETCIIGSGGQRAQTAARLWRLCVLLVVVIAGITATALPSSAYRPSLWKQSWWRIACLPLALSPDQISRLIGQKTVAHDH